MPESLLRILKMPIDGTSRWVGEEVGEEEVQLPVIRVRAARQAKACRSTFIEWSDWVKSTMAPCQAPKLRRHCAPSSTTPVSNTKLPALQPPLPPPPLPPPPAARLSSPAVLPLLDARGGGIDCWLASVSSHPHKLTTATQPELRQPVITQVMVIIIKV